MPSPYDSDEMLLKIDHQLNAAHRFSGSYFLTSGSNTVRAGGGNLPWASQEFKWTQHNVNVSDTWVVSTSKINQAWFSFNRNFGGRLNVPATSLTDLGSSAVIQGAPSLPQITVSGFFTLDQRDRRPEGRRRFLLRARRLQLDHGARTPSSWAASSRYNKTIQDTLLNNYGVFTFNNSVTRNALADFLIGIPERGHAGRAGHRALEQLVRRGLHAGRLPRQVARDAEPRAALGRADARHRSAEPVHDLRARPEVHRQACTRRPGSCSTAIPASSAASSRRAWITSRRASASSGIRSATARRRSAPRAASSTAASRATSGTR